MSEKGSVFQKGGGGTNFEQAIQAAFFTTLIIKGNAPCIPTNEIIEVAFQTTNRGYETDDLLIVAKSHMGNHRLLVQVKHNISFTFKDVIFKEVIKGFWKDYSNSSIFDKTKDRLIVIKSGFTQEEKNHLKAVLNWAKTHATENDFITEVNRIKAKKERLDVLRSCLQEANNNIQLTDKEIWEFLKCFDALEYDFSNQNSVDEIYFLNLIKLSKSKNTTANETEIWGSILSFVAKLNKNGGSATSESIINEELYKYFDITKLNSNFESIKKLKSDSKAILDPLKNTIGDYHLNRNETERTILDSINNFQFTIVTGDPGVGKSAEIKDVLNTQFSFASVFVFRADQYNEPHIANVFSSQGVNETIYDIFSCISLIPDKIIFIDSLEKLLEADPECAFRQLLFILKEFPDIKFIGSSRKYAIDLIFQKFGISKNELSIVEVLPLNDTEIKIISDKFHALRNVLKNENIKRLLRSPKYLDFSLNAINKTSDDYSEISLKQYKEKLWNTLVVDDTNTKDGLPIKRENAFMEIAVNRAKEMKLFIKPVNADSTAIALLENDGIIFQENQNRKFSPTHDILEDWALVRFVSTIYEDNPDNFFTVLGNEPAIRRAFRLWIEDNLVDNSTKINELLTSTFSNESIERFWADEILIAVFRSENCKVFFLSFKEELLNDKTNYNLLNRCIHLLCTGCKETYISNNGYSTLVPIGSGWGETLLFIEKNIAEINTLRISVYSFLYNWNLRIMFQRDTINETELIAAKNIIIYFINQIEAGDQYWQQDFLKKITKEFISFLFQLASIAKTEIEELIERAFNYKEKRDSWKLNSFYESVIFKSLSGLGNDLIVKENPELIVKTAWREWKLQIKEEDIANTRSSQLFGQRSLDGDEYWGINTNHEFYPSGIYKTPFYDLLWYHPYIGLKFITEFINYSVDFHVAAIGDTNHVFSQIEVRVNDGTIVKKWASQELWVAYRALSVTNHLLESVLMSLEKYLFDITENHTERKKENLNSIIDYLIINSNNVAIDGVLISFLIAFPDQMSTSIIPLLAVPEYYEFDLNRALQETSSLAPYDNNIPGAQKARYESNQLPHRKKYWRGLADFIVDYQFKNGLLIKEIHTIFDLLHETLDPEDLLWEKKLTEIDIRKWEAKDFNEKNNTFRIQPKYGEGVSALVESNKKYSEAQEKTFDYSNIIVNAYKNKNTLEFKIWQECYEYYSHGENLNRIFDRNITLAIIGLRDFKALLNSDENKWCVNTINEAIIEFVNNAFNNNFDFTKTFNFLEKEIALTSIHYLFLNVDSEKETNSLICLMTYLLFAPFHDHELKYIIGYFRSVFTELLPNVAKRIWCCLIKYSEFRKLNPNFYSAPDAVSDFRTKEKNFIENNAEDINISINVSKINFENNEAYIIARALVITPYSINEKLYSDFVNVILPLITNDLQNEDDFGYRRRRNNRQISYEEVIKVKIYLSDLLLNVNSEISKKIIDLLLDPVYSENLEDRKRNRSDLFEFSSDILKQTIYRLDELVANSTNELLNKMLIENFWKLWESLYLKIKDSNKLYFTSILFLDIKWMESASHWKVLENKYEFYQRIVVDFGKSNTQAMLNVFSTIGEKTFLPDGINWLVEIYKKEIETSSSLISPSATRMIEKLFYNHIAKIKNSKKLIENYIWILNRMVDLGSSEAYLFRENVITYKKSIN